MWTRDVWARDGRRAVGRRLLHAWAVVAVIYAGWLLAGCAEAGAPSVNDVESASSAAPSPSQPPAASEAVGAEPATLADLFPEGPGKALVLDTCGECHAVACSTIGQRPLARWAGLEEDHRDKASNLSEENLETIFAYLSEHFNDSRPEPRVPPRFLEAGCTPF